MDPALTSEVHRIVSDVKQSVLHPGSQLAPDLKRLRILLPSSNTNSVSEFHDINTARDIFHKQEYSALLICLIRQFSVDWIGNVPKGLVEETVDVFFICGWHTEAFLILGRELSNSSGYQQQKIIQLLQSLIANNAIESIISKQCQNKIIFWDEVVNLLVSLPDRISSKVQDSTSMVLSWDNYTTFMCTAICSLLNHTQMLISSGKDAQLTPLCQVFGRLCLKGRADQLWKHLTPWFLSKFSQTEPGIWLRLSEAFIQKIPDQCMESCITSLLQQIPWFMHVNKFLGLAVLNNRKVKLLLTNKLLLMRYSYKPLLIQNIIGYLSSSQSFKSLFTQTVLSLMDVWANESAVRHTSYDQQFYICQAISVSFAFIQSSENADAYADLKADIMQRMLTGMPHHLDSSVDKVRTLGMVIGENISKMCGNTNPIEFKFEKDKDVMLLNQLLVPPEDPGVEHLIQNFEKIETKVENEQMEDKQDEEESLDSDDDLEPYDMSHDTKSMDVKAPLYVGECMEGLLSSDKAQQIEICLRSASSLIRKHTDMVKEIAAEFMKIILHLEKTFYMEDFYQCRHSAMVALLVSAPREAAPYLTSQVYAPNYHLRHRMDMLQVIAQAAQELAEPEKNDAAKTVTDVQNWKDVVQQRIEKKTRYFHKAKQVVLTENRFSPLAGIFFFPLLSNYDTKEATLDLLGDDHHVLRQLLYTLAVVMHSATNSPIVPRMATALSEFLWLFIYHPQAGVRQGVLFATCMLLLATPPHLLMTELQEQILHLKQWLEDSVEKDPDSDCRQLALQGLHLLQTAVKKQFNPAENTA